MVRLSRSDLERVLAFAAEAVDAAREPDRQDQRLLERVARLIDTEEQVYYVHMDAGHRLLESVQLGKPAKIGDGTPPDEVLRKENPFVAFTARTGRQFYPATRLWDLISREALRRTRFYAAIPDPEASAVQVRMPGYKGSARTLEVLQLDREFTDRQLALLDAVRPWLEAYEDRRILAMQLATVRSAPADLAMGSRLSGREQQVLDRLANGESNQEIADALHISPLTVRTHLEHIYAKLEVTSRTAALARTGRTTTLGARDASSPQA